MPSTRGSAAPPMSTIARTAAAASGSADSRGRDGDEQRLGQQRPQEVPPRRAERRAHRDLSRARRAPRQQQVRDVHHRQQQQQSGRRKRDEDDRAEIADDRVEERPHHEDAVLRLIGILPRELVPHRRQRPAIAAGSSPGLKRTNASKAWPIESGLCCGEPQIGLSRNGERVRRDANDERATAGESDRRADRPGIAAEDGAPRALRQDDAAPRLGRVVVGSEAPAGRHWQAEQVEEPF